MPAPTLIDTLTLSLDAVDYECQLKNARLETTNNETRVTTFCGNYTSNDETYAVTLDGYQDWGAVDSLCDMLWTASESSSTITAVMEVGTATFSCEVSGRKPPVGGPAGASLEFTISLPVQGSITKA